MSIWPPTTIRALRWTITAVDATMRGAGSGRTTAKRGEDSARAGRSTVDLASRLRRLAAELRRVAHDVPCDGLLDGPCGLPERAEVDAATATREAMADVLRTGHTADSRDFGVQVARLLGLAPKVAGAANEPTRRRPSAVVADGPAVRRDGAGDEPALEEAGIRLAGGARLWRLPTEEAGGAELGPDMAPPQTSP